MPETQKSLAYWPYCASCHQPFEFDAHEPFAHCRCGTTEWGDPRPAAWIPKPRAPAATPIPAGWEKMRAGKSAVFWRDDALEAAAKIAEAYQANGGAAADIRALKSGKLAGGVQLESLLPADFPWVIASTSLHHYVRTARGREVAAVIRPIHDAGKSGAELEATQAYQDAARIVQAVNAAAAARFHTGFDPEMGFVLDAANAGELAAYESGCAGMMEALQRILDGEDTGAGASTAPWEGLRRRVLKLVGGDAVARGDLALLKEAVRFGQFAEDMLRQFGLAQPLREAIFRLVGESTASAPTGDADQEAEAPAEDPRSPLAEALEEFERQLAQWARAYPVSVFPEVKDWQGVDHVLASAGMSLTRLSAANMRHVVTTLHRAFQQVRAARSSELPERPTEAMLEAVLKAHPGALSGYAVQFLNDWEVAALAHRRAGAQGAAS
ncbi:hypothetical protein [Ramlibacter sp. AN1133]|uniref:hypothetical protein n=1 Tax=Ramlibacter sp. AN1133 TaxID=3133429 RepID=UPI0030C3D0A4